ncbi:8846_t:CDS:2, partial [Entrophospora sp. SA101]
TFSMDSSNIDYNSNINDNNNDGRTYTMYSNNNTIRSSTMDSNTIVMNSSDSSTLRSNTLDSNVKMSMMYDNFKIVEDDEYQYNNHLQQKMPTTSQFNGFDNINSFGPANVSLKRSVEFIEQLLSGEEQEKELKTLRVTSKGKIIEGLTEEHHKVLEWENVGIALRKKTKLFCKPVNNDK